MSSPPRSAFFQLHFAVFLFGFTAILGALIDLNAMVLVWWRLLITCISLLLLAHVWPKLRGIDRRDLVKLLGIGCLVALHWVTFFGSVKLANASVALVCYSTTALFTALLSPFFTNQKISRWEILLGILVIPGMVLVVQGVTLEMQIGIWVGLLSAFLIALFTLGNKEMVTRYDPMFITFVELGAGLLLLSLIGVCAHLASYEFEFWPDPSDWMLILVLALLCTTLGYVLQLKALRYISAFVSNLTMNLEPIYGILLAYFILQENQELSIKFYLGVTVIFVAIFIYPLVRKGNS